MNLSCPAYVFFGFHELYIFQIIEQPHQHPTAHLKRREHQRGEYQDEDGERFCHTLIESRSGGGGSARWASEARCPGTRPTSNRKGGGLRADGPRWCSSSG